jgi:hypothetical protein
MAGLGTTASANINGVIWDELLVNAATGILISITWFPGTLTP